MPKLNVSVPDPLWERAVKSSSVGSSPSAIVQDALRRAASPSADRAWMQPPTDAGDLLAAATQRLAAQALKEFQDGYRSALARVPDLNWSNLDGFARAGFDFERWISPWSSDILHDAVADHPELLAYGPDDAQPDPERLMPKRQRDDLPWFWKLAEDLGSRVDPIGHEQYNITRTDTFVRGYEAGLKAAYELVDSGTLPPTDD